MQEIIEVGENGILQIFENAEFGAKIRAIKIDDEAWFVGNDVAIALGYAKPYEAVTRHIDSDDTLIHGVMDSIGRKQKTKIINESGMYTLIIMSELPNARKFKRWITKEVLPSIMRTGSYILPQLSANELILEVAKQNIIRDKRIDNLEESQARIEQRIDDAIDILSTQTPDQWKKSTQAKINHIVKENSLTQARFLGQLYKELDDTGICLHNRLVRFRSRMRNNGATYRESMTIGKLDIVSRDKKLREAFGEIIQKYEAQYGMQENWNGRLINKI